MTISRFEFVPYDSAAADAQNHLRGQFKFKEGYVAKRWKDDIEALEIPNNEYREETARVRTKLLDYINRDKIPDALIQLEILYFLLGKDIRLKCIERLGL